MPLDGYYYKQCSDATIQAFYTLVNDDKKKKCETMCTAHRSVDLCGYCRKEFECS